MKWFDDDIDKEFERMRQRMERMVGSLTRPGAATLCGGTGWRPSLDLYETDDELTVLVDVAGIQPQDVDDTEIKSRFIRLDYDVEKVASAIIKAGLPPLFAEKLRVGAG